MRIFASVPPKMVTPARIKLFLVSLALVCVTTVCFAGQRGLPPQEGILNFGKINDSLYRGAQPGAEGIQNLKRLGIKTIINLRMTEDVWKGEEAEARASGILYTNLPMKGLGRPTDDQVGQALSLINTLPSPVFIHCEHGCDRTGTIIACYRMKHDQWSSQSSFQEARQYGFSRWERGMKKCVLEFGKTVRLQRAKPQTVAVPSNLPSRTHQMEASRYGVVRIPRCGLAIGLAWVAQLKPRPVNTGSLISKGRTT